jgi:hypothetical protein
MVGLVDPVGAVAAGCDQASESVGREVPESADNPAGGFDDAVDGLCRSLNCLIWSGRIRRVSCRHSHSTSSHVRIPGSGV